MRLPCPLCGARDIREFSHMGAALARPDGGDWGPDWNDYLHNRDNPAGQTEELWYHGQGCGGWLVVTRDTVRHEVRGARLAGEGAGA
ncbi:sarcosine oxidase subunit delta [Roseovarius autotrophicus]|uniref:sarcosine oxidase subunit delta n=1 Tax=Roseovarius autotrophicus TaxID=2824121 RepID=UPI001A0106C1|nr:sarcosine oxidase subunit delta [Roseovarius autotrophicus]MBE0452254.1 sarcosine oxidase subunit delta [Roseovarius sp.]